MFSLCTNRLSFTKLDSLNIHLIIVCSHQIPGMQVDSGRRHLLLRHLSPRQFLPPLWNFDS